MPKTARRDGRPDTGGAFQLSSTRRAAFLAILVCAMALSVAVPLRTYLTQRAELSEAEQQRAELVRQVDDLRRREAELSDPAYVEAEARRRLGYARPGETPYIVQAPSTPVTVAPPPAPMVEDEPWYTELWSALSHPR